MKATNDKLNLLRQKLEADGVVKVMIMGFGSVGGYLLDYLVGLQRLQL